MKLKIVVVCLLFLFKAYAGNDSKIKSFVESPFINKGLFGLMVTDIEQDKVVYSYNPNKLITPASIMKSVTTATALELLGPDYQFKTTIEYDGIIDKGVLYGNLYIKGGGDPTLGSAYLKENLGKSVENRCDFFYDWAQAVKALNIDTIIGSVISDETIYDNEVISLKWLGEDYGTYYGVGCYGLNVFDNVMQIVLSTAGGESQPTIVNCIPKVENLKIYNYVKTHEATGDSLFCTGMPFSDERFMFGRMAKGKERVTLDSDIPDPAMFIAKRTTETLENLGVVVKGVPNCMRKQNIDARAKKPKRTEITAVYSPKLSEIIAITNYVSHNLYADALIKAVGLLYDGADKDMISSFEKGTRVLCSYWKSKGLDSDPLVLYDGSGLSIADKVTFSFMTGVLKYMKNESKYSEIYEKSLPVVGIDGSVQYFLRETAFQGKGRVKSGSMTGVRCYAGYMYVSGKSYIVVVGANNFKCSGSSIRKHIEQLLLDIL